MKRTIAVLITLTALSLILSCDETIQDNANILALNEPAHDAALPLSREFYLGLTPFPFDMSSVRKIEYVYDRIATDADLICLHFDNGIPWDDALADTYPYTAKIMDDWSYRKSHIPDGHKLYIAITPISSMRDGLAPLWNENGDNQPLAGTAWEGRVFNQADVKTAYLNYCKRVIAYFNPDYLAVGIESNLVMMNIKPQWAAYLELQQGIYATLKAAYPDLLVFVTLTGIDLVEGYSGANHADQVTALADIMPYTDYYAISLHPFFAEVPGGSIPADMCDNIFALNTGAKPACITETSFPAQRLTMRAYDPAITLAGSPVKQKEYFEYLLAQAQEHHLLFVVNFLVRDYDRLWWQMGRPENIFKAWKDTGFYNGFGFPRPALRVWKAYLALPVVR
jgi:hypothetical protein